MLDRRHLLGSISSLAIGTPVFHRAVVAAIQEEEGKAKLTAESIEQAQWISGLELTDDEKESILKTVNSNSEQLGPMRALGISELTAPPFHFTPLTKVAALHDAPNRSIRLSEESDVALPNVEKEIAFLSVAELAPLIRNRQLTSRRLTEIYLNRLKRYGKMLCCVVSLLEDSALDRADAMDAELAAGKYRGPLHGIPWGAKDLIDIRGTKTTWGIPYNKDRESEVTATVAERIDAAGAVLVAKLSLGALAMGDKWFEGKTRNPWNPKTGSSGSSAGSASAVVAGLVGFTLGSETLGSITSPSKVCGASGFRPTFGRVSRHGCMPLSWTMDKIGPICRSAEDAALVFNVIHGADGRDQSAKSLPFNWPVETSLQGLRVGYDSRQKIENSKTLGKLQELGCDLVKFELPKVRHLRAMTTIIDVEAASVFDRLLRDGHTEGWNTWTKSFRSAQYVSAVDYLRIQRYRVELMEAMEDSMQSIDFLADIRDVFHTNLSGHPSVVIPVDYRDRKSGGKRPVCATFTGHLGEDDRLLGIAHQFQQHSDAQLKHPELDDWLKLFEEGKLDEEEAKSGPETSDDNQGKNEDGAEKQNKKTENKTDKSG